MDKLSELSAEAKRDLDIDDNVVVPNVIPGKLHAVVKNCTLGS